MTVSLDELVQCTECQTWFPEEDITGWQDGPVCWVCEDGDEDVVEEVA